MKQKVLGETIGHTQGYMDLGGPVDQVLEKITDLVSKATDRGYSNIKIVWTEGYSSDDVEWFLQGDRLETDSEYNRRVDNERKQAEQKKKDRLDKHQNELKEYQRLKKKFEGV